MPRVFVSNVDSALGHNISRLFSVTAVGSRKEEENNEEELPEDIEDPDKPKVTEEKQKETYSVVGTFSPRVRTIDNDPLSDPAPVVTGHMFETGDKKRDEMRRLAIEKFAIIGKKPKWVQETVGETQESLQEALLSSDIIVYDLITSCEEATWAIEMLSEQSESFTKPKIFIAVSSIMTWGKTKMDHDDPEAFLAEDEYRRRKAHPNFKLHIAAEKSIIKFGKKSNLKTYVLASGLVYHSGDSIFHYLLKAGWHNEEKLICYGEGNNILPTIHLDDLCNIVVEVADTQPENKYMLAIDDSKHSLYEITKAISEALTTGKVKKVPKEHAFLYHGLTQSDYDMLLVNLRLEPGHVKDMSFEWKYESGLVENLPQLLQEYKDARGLSPLKIVLHGPPASRKTFFAKKIAEHYEIHLIEVEKTVQAAIDRLESRVNGSTNADEQEDDTEADKELLEELKEAAKANNGRYPEEHIINFIREKLRSMPCRNQGYILDGFPNTLEEATQLFRPAPEDEGKDDKGNPNVDDLTIPEFVLTLECSDEYIKENVMALPESAIAGTKNAEEALVRRLEEFRAMNTDENTVLNYFDELEIHPIPIAVENVAPEDVMGTIIKHIGKPHNYGPTPEQLAEKRRLAEEAKIREAALAEEERQKREKEEAERHAKAVAEWNARMEEVRKQEQDVLEAQSVPLRNYLMKFVMPTLTSGLIEVCKIRPEDPIDYLAEYLFRNNPENSS
ncbi:uncharacterized protein BJ171DRAFT_560904 [Polychytrium aggregatum]|uniref:uncharacterized protein n=1 Tax=Polychytrium aggregatum TaxID=110093 RepID=UPI0022FEAC5F|nr:uncharacterized protein BJ171DRAFT_560904 [Polychytrium aggregatum]KAI9209622.1 hypothetical protein BJ171DRAFT_560904 [Polychytrium aggregatum]